MINRNQQKFIYLYIDIDIFENYYPTYISSNLNITIKYGILSLIENLTCSHNEIGRHWYERQGHLLWYSC